MVSPLDNSLHSSVTDNFLNGFSTSSAVLNFFKNVPTVLAIAAPYWSISACSAEAASGGIRSSLFPSVLFPCPVLPTITISKYSCDEDIPSCDDDISDEISSVAMHEVAMIAKGPDSYMYARNLSRAHRVCALHFCCGLADLLSCVDNLAGIFVSGGTLQNMDHGLDWTGLYWSKNRTGK